MRWRRTRHRPDSLWSWFVCFCASVSGAVHLGFSISFGVLLPELMNEFKESRQNTVWVGSLTIGLTFLLGPLGSTLCKTIGCRFTAITGGMICAVGLLLTSFSPSLTLMFFTFSLLYGLGASLIFQAGLLITAKNFCKCQYLAIGFVSLGSSVGVLIFGPLTQFLLDVVGWRGVYRVTSSMFCLVCFCGASFSEPFDAESKTPGERKAVIREAGNGRKNRKLFDCSVFKVPRFTIVVTSLTLMCFGHYTPQLHLVKYCLELGISADSASMLFIFIGLASSVSRIVTGRLCDVSWVNPVYVHQFGDLLVGFLTVTLPVIRSYSGILVFAIFYGIGDGIFITTMNSLLMFTVDEKQRAAALGLGCSLLSIGIAGGPPLAGFLADRYDCYKWAFFAAGILMQCAGILPFALVGLKRNRWLSDKQNQFQADTCKRHEARENSCHQQPIGFASH